MIILRCIKLESQLESEYVQQEIESIALCIEANLKYVYNCYLKDVTTFGFLGHSFVEATKNGLTFGCVKLSTNMTISESGSAQIKITTNQAQRQNK